MVVVDPKPGLCDNCRLQTNSLDFNDVSQTIRYPMPLINNILLRALESATWFVKLDLT